MPTLRAPRFYGDDTLASCLDGHRIFQGSGDPPDSIKLIQKALNDLKVPTTALAVDGIFGPQTGAAVTAYKTSRGLAPNDPVVGPGTTAALDDDFAHEFIDASAATVAGTPFDLGARTGTRDDVEDGFAICPFQNGASMEIGHAVAYAVPAVVLAVWTTAGGKDGTYGVPINNPYLLDTSRAVQEFSQVAFFFGVPEPFALPQDVWAASQAGQGLIGLPTSAPQPVGTDGTIITPHDHGVVLSVPQAPPQPQPQAVFNAWMARQGTDAKLGPPDGLPFPDPSGTIFPFQLGKLTLSGSGTVT
jgi:peptidoglycan hydrolase-like protein with peptidoglycan-binding domain